MKCREIPLAAVFYCCHLEAGCEERGWVSAGEAGDPSSVPAAANQRWGLGHVTRCRVPIGRLTWCWGTGGGAGPRYSPGGCTRTLTIPHHIIDPYFTTVYLGYIGGFVIQASDISIYQPCVMCLYCKQWRSSYFSLLAQICRCQAVGGIN